LEDDYSDSVKTSHSKENSPWNIVVDFTIDMSLSENGIKGMLDEYEQDHHTGMDTESIAKTIRAYTNGYPFLVSRICQLLDHAFQYDRRGWKCREIQILRLSRFSLL